MPGFLSKKDREGIIKAEVDDLRAGHTQDPLPPAKDLIIPEPLRPELPLKVAIDNFMDQAFDLHPVDIKDREGKDE